MIEELSFMNEKQKENYVKGTSGIYTILLQTNSPKEIILEDNTYILKIIENLKKPITIITEGNIVIENSSFDLKNINIKAKKIILGKQEQVSKEEKIIMKLENKTNLYGIKAEAEYINLVGNMVLTKPKLKASKIETIDSSYIQLIKGNLEAENIILTSDKSLKIAATEMNSNEIELNTENIEINNSIIKSNNIQSKSNKLANLYSYIETNDMEIISDLANLAYGDAIAHNQLKLGGQTLNVDYYRINCDNAINNFVKNNIESDIKTKFYLMKKTL